MCLILFVLFSNQNMISVYKINLTVNLGDNAERAFRITNYTFFFNLGNVILKIIISEVLSHHYYLLLIYFKILYFLQSIK